jgi:heme/copper-type cytochrome/quinol oxidase subunit 2
MPQVFINNSSLLLQKIRSGTHSMKILKTRNLCQWLAVALLMVFNIHINAEEPPSDSQYFEIRISERTVQLDPNVIRVNQGTQVALSWTSDEAGSLHLHGYDIEFDVGPERAETITFMANATGRFPVTSHGFGGEGGHGHKALLYLEVYPD